MEQRSEERNGLSSLGKGAALLACFSRRRPTLTLGELARLTKLPKTTTHRLIRSLCDAGLLAQSEDDGTYRLGIKLIELSDVARLSLPIYRNGEPLLEGLALETGAVVFLCVPDDTEALYVARVHAPTMARHGHLPVGERLPLSVGAGPIAMLASLGEKTVERVLAEPIVARTPFAIVEPALVRERLAEIRERGYSVSWRDVHADMVGVGAAVFDAGDRPVGAVSVGGPVEEWSEERVELTAMQVMRAASQLSRTLGHLENRLALVSF